MEINNVAIWAVIGVVLLIMEILTLTTYMLALSASAFLVSVLVYFFGKESFGVNMQMLVFAIESIMAILTLKRIPMHKNKSNIGQSKGEAEGKIGKIIKIHDEKKGIIQFDTQIFGAKEWEFISDEIVELNQNAQIIEVIGNRLKIDKVKK